MGKYKYLFKNIGIMTISNFGTKILSFLMVPLYTNLLSTSEYGTYDLFINNIIFICSYFIIEYSRCNHAFQHG